MCEPVLVAVPEERVRALQAELEGESGAVHFAHMGELGRNPACIIPAWRDFVAEHAVPGKPMRGIGEPIWATRSADELVECQRHEALLNLAFADAEDFWLVCPYDTEALEEDVLDEAERSHPVLAGDGISRKSEAYVEPARATGPFDGELEPPTGQPVELAFDEGGVRSVRSFVSDQAVSAGLDTDRTKDLALVAGELATNSVLHAGGRGTVRVWRDPSAVVCEVRDDGRFEEPMLGRRRPQPDRPNGRGLWIVNHLCDLVQMRSLPGGSVVRVRIDLNHV
jgi:anti-sigma regulatory factor (Ser/Thr protein kinase)